MSENTVESCYIAIFEGECGTSVGGVYKIAASWFTSHPGGNYMLKRKLFLAYLFVSLISWSHAHYQC